MRTSLLRSVLLASGCSLLAACGSPTAPSAASSRADRGVHNRAPNSVTIAPGSGAVLDDGSFSDQTPPPEIYIPQEDGTLRPVGNPGGHGAPGSIDITRGGGAVLDGGGLNDGNPPPEVSVDGRLVNPAPAP